MESGAGNAFCPVCVGKNLGADHDGEHWDVGTGDHEGEFGGYPIHGVIGRGGMGIVLKAWDKKLKRMVALKVLQGGLFSAPIEVLRFQSEAMMVASLQHPNIVTIHEAGVFEEQPFIAMEFVGGRSLSSFANHPADAAMAARLCLELSDAIAHAHSRAVIHRDLKPSNVLLDIGGRVKVVDFGLARRTDSTQDLTLTGQILGTPAFMAPEQADPRLGPIDVRTDVYGMGAILYFLLTGRPPFDAPTVPLLLEQVLQSDVVPIRARSPRVPIDLETVAMKCLSKEPARRYGTAAAVSEELRRYLAGEPVVGRPMGMGEKTRRWILRHKALATALILGVFALAAGLAALVNGVNSRVTRRQAQLFNYVANVQAANRSVVDGNLGFAHQLLDQVSPDSDEEDLRSVDWGFVRARARDEDDQTLDLQAGPLRYIALDSTGHRFAAVGYSNLVIRSFDANSSEFRVPISPERYGRMAQWHPDGGSVFLNNPNGLVRYFLREPRKEFWPIGACTHFVLSPDGSRVAHCTIPEPRGNEVIPLDVWDSRTGQKVASHPELGGCLARWDSARQITCLDRNGSVWEWNLQSKKARRILVGNKQVSTASFAPTNHWLARAIDRAGTIELVQTTHGSGIGVLPGITEASFVAFSPDSTWLFSTATDLRVHISRLNANTGTWSPMFSKQGHRAQVTGLVSKPDRNSVVSCSEDGTVRSWSPGQKRHGHFAASTLAGLYAGLGKPILSPDGSWAVVPSSVDKTKGTLVRLWNLRDGTFSPEFVLLPMRFSPDSRWLLGYKATQEFELWDVAKFERIRTFKIGRNVQNHAVKISAGGDWLAILGPDGDNGDSRLTLFRIATGETYQPFGSDKVEFFSPAKDANHFLVTFKDGARVLDLATRIPRRISLTYSESPAISPDGSLCALGTFENRIEIHRTVDGAHIGTLIGHQSAILDLQFSADNRTLVSSSYDQTIRFWNMATLRQTVVVQEPYPIESIDLSLTGTSLMIWTSEGFEAINTAVPGGFASRPVIPNVANPSWQLLSGAVQAHR